MLPFTFRNSFLSIVILFSESSAISFIICLINDVLRVNIRTFNLLRLHFICKLSYCMKKTSLDYVLVGIQFLLFGLFLLDFFESFTLLNLLKWAAFVSTWVGFFILVLAILQLRNSLTAFPTPKDNSSLIINGLYQYVRHPIYTGILLTVFGYSFYSTSYSRLGISIALTFLFFIKTEYEERQLTKKYSAYPEYAKKTGRFFPKLVSSFRI